MKIEIADSQLPLIRELADAGVAVIAHLGLKPQSVGVLGSYRFQGRTAGDALDIVALATCAAQAGAAGILLEAVPPEVSAAVVDAVGIPIIGCGAGPACDAHVFVTHDALGLTDRTPRFVLHLGDLATPMIAHFADYVNKVDRGEYPAAEHCYEMPADEKALFLKGAAPF